MLRRIGLIGGIALAVLTALAGGVRAAAIHAHGGAVIAYTAMLPSGHADVTLIDVQHGSSVSPTDRLTQERFLGWSADGMRFAIGQVDTPPALVQNRTLVFDLASGRIGQYNIWGIYATFSPDGRWIAFTRMFGATRGELWTLDTHTGQQRAISGRIGVSGLAAWLPDGGAILMGGRANGGSFQIYRFPRDGGTPTPITQQEGNQFNPRLSPDGRTLLYESAQRRALAVMLMPLDGSAPPRSITAGDGFCEMPAWSPDGTRIAVICRGVYGLTGRALFVAHLAHDQQGSALLPGEIAFLAPGLRPIQLQWTAGDQIVFAGTDGFLWQIDAPRAAGEAPSASPRPIRRVYTSDTYAPLGVRP
ncbi:MAG: LpqB family beta-propeller domain-containing protein [bacterium]|nr:LpqB family beta-propeller domain-containing protein [bacterium]